MDDGRSAAAATALVWLAVLSAGAGTAPGSMQRSQSVEIVSGAGKCLDVHEPDQYNNGGRVQVWQCNGTKQQAWFIERGALRSGAGKCLDVYAPDQQRNGARVQIWDCNGAPQQRWFLDRKLSQIRSDGGKCLDVSEADQDKDGAAVQVWDCNGTRQQRWLVRPR